MKRIIILLAILTTLVSCEKENVNDSTEPCTCIKLYFNNIGQVVNANEVLSNDCKNVGSYPDDLQNNGGLDYIINCNN